MRVLFVGSLALVVAACSSGNSSSNAAGGGAGASEAGVSGSGGSAGGGAGGTAGGGGSGGAATAGQGGVAGSDAGTPDSGGDADVDGGNPCGCPAPTYGQWGACSYLDQDCSSTGTRDRSVTYYDCVGGSCQPRVESESDTTGCARTTEGQSCGTGTVNGQWSTCQRSTSQTICDPNGTQTRSNAVSVCKSDQCTTSQVPETQSCTMSTKGCYRITTTTEKLKRIGTGGSAATLACPKGYLATGIWSRAGTRDDSMALYCSKMGPDGTLSNETLSPKVGGTGGSTVVAAKCGQGEVMVGLYGKVAPERHHPGRPHLRAVAQVGLLALGAVQRDAERCAEYRGQLQLPLLHRRHHVDRSDGRQMELRNILRDVLHRALAQGRVHERDGGSVSLARRSALLAAVSLTLAACGSSSGSGSTLTRIASLDTEVPDSIQAGQQVGAVCVARDAHDKVIDTGPDVHYALRIEPAASVSFDASGVATAIRTGQIEVSCALPDQSLIDPTPALLRIVPGPPHQVITTLDHDQVTAGDAVKATCQVFDAYGNEVSGASPTLGVAPSAATHKIKGLEATLTRAGDYRLACQVPGTSSDGAPLEVLPGAPAELTIGKVPDLPIYSNTQVLQLTHSVVDSFGNAVGGVPVQVDSSPQARETLGSGRFRFDDGNYTLSAYVQGQSCGASDSALCKHAHIYVNGHGPLIACDGPGDGSMLNTAPGQKLTFHASVADPAHTTQVKVGGQIVPMAADGSFSAPVTTRYGINFVDLSATGDNGIETSGLCAFLAADHWLPGDKLLPDSVSLSLRPKAIDDGKPSQPISSLTDALRLVLNSSEVAKQVDAALTGQTFPVPVLGTTTIQGVTLNGPNDADTSLVKGGLKVHVRANNLQVRLVGGLTGYADIQYIDTTFIVDIELGGTHPSASLRKDSATVKVGHVTPHVGWLVNFIINTFTDPSGIIAQQVNQALTDYASKTLDQLLQQLTLNLPAVPLTSLGGTPIQLTPQVDFSRVDASSKRLLVSFKTGFSAKQGASSSNDLGVALPSQNPDYDPAGTAPVTASVYAGVVNQALHTLWRADFFTGTLTGLPNGGSADLSLGLPPVAYLSSGKLALDVGAATVTATLPGVLTNYAMRVGARGSTTLTLQGSTLALGKIQIDEVHFAPVCSSASSCTPLSGQTQTTLESFLKSTLQTVLDQSLGKALPTLPIPSFAIPQALGGYNLPVGKSLGLTGPKLTVKPPMALLDGGFGAQ